MTPATFLFIASASFGLLGLGALACWIMHGFGVKAGLGLRSERFDRVRHMLNLHDTNWVFSTIDFNDAWPFLDATGRLRFMQQGNRIRFEGTDPSGGRWSGEGLVCGTHLSMVYLARVDGGHFVGTLELDAGDRIQEMRGTRTTWTGGPGGMTIVPIRFDFGLHPVSRNGSSSDRVRGDSLKQGFMAPLSKIDACGGIATADGRAERTLSRKVVVRAFRQG